MTTYPLNSFFVYLKGALLVTFSVAILALTVSTTLAANHQTTVYKTANIEGPDIFYWKPGKKDAPTTLLLHGLPTSSRMYSELVEDLADEYYLIASKIRKIKKTLK